jgi:TRAP-type C4-dicarboxylate transport system permease small subunit
VKGFFRLYDAIVDALAWVSGAALAAVFVMIVVAVSLRTLRLGEPDWILPTTEYAMLFIGTLAAPWLLRERGHVVIDIVRMQVSPATRRAMAQLVAACSTVLFIALVYFSIPVLRAMWGEYEMRAYLMPKALLVAPVTVSFALLAIGFFRALIGQAELYEDIGRPKTGEL